MIILEESLIKKGNNIRFFFFFDNLDATKRFPEYIDQKFQNEKKGIKLLRSYLSKEEHLDPDMIQNKIIIIANDDLQITPCKMFKTIYQVILGKKSGLKLGTFLSLLDKQNSY